VHSRRPLQGVLFEASSSRRIFEAGISRSRQRPQQSSDPSSPATPGKLMSGKKCRRLSVQTQTRQRRQRWQPVWTRGLGGLRASPSGLCCFRACIRAMHNPRRCRADQKDGGPSDMHVPRHLYLEVGRRFRAWKRNWELRRLQSSCTARTFPFASWGPFAAIRLPLCLSPKPKRPDGGMAMMSEARKDVS